jgi:hypothetical protein
VFTLRNRHLPHLD